MWPNPLFPTNLITFTEEILNKKLYFFCSNMYSIQKLFYKISQNILKKRCAGVCFPKVASQYCNFIK